MPILNEARFLDQSLASVFRQDYPSDRMEVLVADGRSTDGSRAILERAERKYPSLHIIDNPRRTTASGLNAAVRASRGEVILRVDGHTEIAPDYIRQCIYELRRTGADNVGGPITPVGNGAFGEAVAIATSRVFGVGGSRARCSQTEGFVDTVFLGAWSRPTFEWIGLFDENLICNEDDEFNYRLRGRGGRILLSPRIRSRYAVRATPARLWVQYFRYGFWKVRILQKHALQMQVRQFVPPIFVGSMALFSLLSPFSTRCWLLLRLEAGLYAVLNLVASAAGAKHIGARSVLYLPLVFGMLHFSYGLGFLKGVADSLNRWFRRARRSPPLGEAPSRFVPDSKEAHDDHEAPALTSRQ